MLKISQKQFSGRSASIKTSFHHHRSNVYWVSMWK